MPSASLTYSLTLRVLHWLTALCMFVVIPLAWYMTSLDRHDPLRKTGLTCTSRSALRSCC